MKLLLECIFCEVSAPRERPDMEGKSIFFFTAGGRGNFLPQYQLVTNLLSLREKDLCLVLLLQNLG